MILKSLRKYINTVRRIRKLNWNWNLPALPGDAIFTSPLSVVSCTMFTFGGCLACACESSGSRMHYWTNEWMRRVLSGSDVNRIAIICQKMESKCHRLVAGRVEDANDQSHDLIYHGIVDDTPLLHSTSVQASILLSHMIRSILSWLCIKSCAMTQHFKHRCTKFN